MRSEEFLNGDIGLFMQDSVDDRSPDGERWPPCRALHGRRSPIRTSAAGRFVATRHWDKTPCMPCWTDFAPRFGVSYDLFGNARTALKGTFNKYMAGQTLSYAQRYNPLRIQSDDPDLARRQRRQRRPGDRDRAEQQPGVRSAGAVASSPDPDGLAREYDIETQSRHSARAVPRPVGVRFVVPPLDAQRTADGQLSSSRTRTTSRSTWSARSTDRCSRPTRWTPTSAARSIAIDYNSTDGDKRSRVYNGYELG